MSKTGCLNSASEFRRCFLVHGVAEPHHSAVRPGWAGVVGPVLTDEETEASGIRAHSRLRAVLGPEPGISDSRDNTPFILPLRSDGNKVDGPGGPEFRGVFWCGYCYRITPLGLRDCDWTNRADSVLPSRASAALILLQQPHQDAFAPRCGGGGVAADSR